LASNSICSSSNTMRVTSTGYSDKQRTRFWKGGGLRTSWLESIEKKTRVKTHNQALHTKTEILGTVTPRSLVQGHPNFE
jgi:hypothetical protein